MTIHEVSISELKPYEKNAKKHPEKQVEIIANSLREFGFKQPVVADKDGVIVAGHGRVLAAKKLGMETVPVLYADDLTEDQIKAFRLADNKTAESEWDFELLNFELDDIEMDMEQFGFEIEEDPDEKEIVEDELPEEEEIDTKCKPGDVWQIGNHRLICGDSTDQATIEKLTGGVQIDLLLTDPPYNCNVGNCERPNSSHNNVHIMNDHMEENVFIDFLTKALQSAENVMKKGAAYYIWYAGLHHIEFESAVRNIESFKLHEQLVWVKSHFVLGRNSDYQWMHEPCLYGWKDGAAHYFTDSRAEGTVIEDKDVKLSTLKKDELIALCEKWMGLNKSTTILRAEKPMSADLHPTVKPQELLTTLIRNSSRQTENVLDIFGGSGSTLIACEQLNRICYMCELDPHYCDVILQRYVNFVGSDKEVYLIKENGERIPYSEVK